MLQSVSRTITNHLSTNWPILWAARIDVALACGLVLLAIDVPIFWLARRAEHDWGLPATQARGFTLMVAVPMALGLIVLWLISVGRVYARGISPQMIKYPRFVDILLGTIIIVAPAAAVVFAVTAPSHMDVGSLLRGFFSLSPWISGWLVGTPLALSTILAVILTGILRSSMKVAMLSLLVCFLIVLVVEHVGATASRLLFPHIDNAGTAIDLLILVSFIVWLIWMSYGTARIRTRERLMSITFPSLFIFVACIQTDILHVFSGVLLAPLGVDSNSDNRFAIYSDLRIAIMYMPPFIFITILISEVLARRWMRLTLMPK